MYSSAIKNATVLSEYSCSLIRASKNHLRLTSLFMHLTEKNAHRTNPQKQASDQSGHSALTESQTAEFGTTPTDP
jgi:hypothetical protein